MSKRFNLKPFFIIDSTNKTSPKPALERITEDYINRLEERIENLKVRDQLSTVKNRSVNKASVSTEGFMDWFKKK